MFSISINKHDDDDDDDDDDDNDDKFTAKSIAGAELHADHSFQTQPDPRKPWPDPTRQFMRLFGPDKGEANKVLELW